MSKSKPTVPTLAIYGGMTIPLAFAGLPVAIYLGPYYAGDLGVSLTWVGLILMLARVTDVVTDPLIGRWSDHTRTRFGRRKPWIAAGVPVMMLAACFLFLPQELPDWVQPFATGSNGGWWLLGSVILFYLGWTMITIAYAAWGTELTDDYDERSRVSGAREIGATVGLVLAAAAGVVFAEMAPDQSPARASIAGLALAFLIALPIMTILLFRFVREPAPETNHQVSLREGLPLILRNRPFLRLAGALFLGALGTSMNGACVILFYEHVLDLKAETPTLLAIYLAFGIIGAPFWIWLGGRISKHRAMVVATLFLAVVFVWVPFLGPDDKPFVYAVAILTGLCLAATPLLTASMMADIIDFDELQSGEQRTGLFVAFYNMAKKMADALGIGIALPLVELFGFRATESNDEGGLLALTVFYCMVPIALWLLAAATLWHFPITRERHDEIRQQIEKNIL